MYKFRCRNRVFILSKWTQCPPLSPNAIESHCLSKLTSSSVSSTCMKLRSLYSFDCLPPTRSFSHMGSHEHFMNILLGGWQEKFGKMSRATDMEICALTHSPSGKYQKNSMHVWKQRKTLCAVVGCWWTGKRLQDGCMDLISPNPRKGGDLLEVAQEHQSNACLQLLQGP